jgi:hypothetical protein
MIYIWNNKNYLEPHCLKFATYFVRFKVLTAMTVKIITVFRNVMPRSLYQLNDVTFQNTVVLLFHPYTSTAYLWTITAAAWHHVSSRHCTILANPPITNFIKSIQWISSYSTLRQQQIPHRTTKAPKNALPGQTDHAMLQQCNAHKTYVT